MRVRELVLPRQAVYLIEGFKYEAVLAYGLIVFTLALCLSHALLPITVQHASAEATYFQVPTYPLSGKPAIANSEIAPIINVPPGSSIWPVHGKVFTEFGAPDPPYQAHHTGIDISTAKRAGVSPVTVFREGTVIRTGPDGGLGNCVIVDHGGGLTSLYGHLYNITVTTGQHVVPGDTIGHEGSTGHSTGPHVHFEIRQDGRPVNPHSFVPGNP